MSITSKINIEYLLNRYVADSAVFFIKLHNIHWNIVGEDFVKIHKYTQGLYEHFGLVFDSFAETLKMREQQVFGSMSEFLTVTSLKELKSDNIFQKEALHIILEDLQMFMKTATMLREMAHKEGDIASTLIAENEVSFLLKEIWFLKSMLIE